MDSFYIYTFYICILLISTLAGYFKIIPIDMVISAFSFVIGHAAGLATPNPTNKEQAK